jgi:hypothetical protein
MVRLIQSGFRDDTSPVGTHNIHVHFNENQWTCRVLPRVVARGRDDDVLKLAREASVEQVGYRLTGGAHGVEEIWLVYDHRAKIVIADVRASELVTPGAETWFPYADQVASLVAKAMFNRQGEEPDGRA